MKMKGPRERFLSFGPTGMRDNRAFLLPRPQARQVARRAQIPRSPKEGYSGRQSESGHRLDVYKEIAIEDNGWLH
jgi:hypothetical protein